MIDILAAVDPTAITHWLALQSLYSGIVFAAVWLFLKVVPLRDGLLRQALWSLVLLRLILPVDLAAPVSLRSLSGQAASAFTADIALVGAIPASAATKISSSDTVLPIRDHARDSAAEAPERLGLAAGRPALETSIFQDRAALGFSSLIVALWFAGIVYFGSSFLVRRRAFRAGIWSSDPLPPKAQQTAERWARRLRVRQAVTLGFTAASSPFTIQTRRPVIAIPADWGACASAQQLDAVIAHEMAHIARHDDLWILLEAAFQIVFFFLPWVWWAGRALDDAREAQADALVLRYWTGRLPTYFSGLLAAVTFAHGGQPHAAAQAASGTRSFARRVRQAARAQSLPAFSAAGRLAGLAGVAAVAIMVLPLARAQQDAPQFSSIANSPIPPIAAAPDIATQPPASPSPPLPAAAISDPAPIAAPLPPEFVGATSDARQLERSILLATRDGLLEALEELRDPDWEEDLQEELDDLKRDLAMDLRDTRQSIQEKRRALQRQVDVAKQRQRSVFAQMNAAEKAKLADDIEQQHASIRHLAETLAQLSREAERGSAQAALGQASAILRQARKARESAIRSVERSLADVKLRLRQAT